MEGGKLRNEIINASWDVPGISGRGASLLSESISICNKGCSRTANWEDVLDIDEKRLSSKDERP